MLKGGERYGSQGLCYAFHFIVAANLRIAVKKQGLGKPEARRHEIRSKAVSKARGGRPWAFTSP
jgi:hypothetical protein